jgi:hypothetical protein
MVMGLLATDWTTVSLSPKALVSDWVAVFVGTWPSADPAESSTRKTMTNMLNR